VWKRARFFVVGAVRRDVVAGAVTEEANSDISAP
jgi:hypothetical protein